jgi:hypothetical protein
MDVEGDNDRGVFDVDPARERHDHAVRVTLTRSFERTNCTLPWRHRDVTGTCFWEALAAHVARHLTGHPRWGEASVKTAGGRWDGPGMYDADALLVWHPTAQRDDLAAEVQTALASFVLHRVAKLQHVVLAALRPPHCRAVAAVHHANRHGREHALRALHVLRQVEEWDEEMSVVEGDVY